MPNTNDYNRTCSVIFHKKEDWEEKESKMLGANIYWFTGSSKTDESIAAEIFISSPSVLSA